VALAREMPNVNEPASTGQCTKMKTCRMVFAQMLENLPLILDCNGLLGNDGLPESREHLASLALLKADVVELTRRICGIPPST
jgi:hypothetical protein